VLDNITLYWLTNTAISAARLYWENKLGFYDVKHVSIPVAVSVFPDEIYAAPRSWAERAYPKLIYYNKLDKGGHFETGGRQDVHKSQQYVWRSRREATHFNGRVVHYPT